MKIKYVLFFFLFLLSNYIFTQTSSTPYWTMDVVVEDRWNGTLSTRKAYLFKNLVSMGDITGFPIGDEPGGGLKTRFEWQRVDGRRDYIVQIFSQMRRNGLEAAFVQYTNGTSIKGEPYWIYWVFLLWDDMEYFDTVTRYNRPVRF
jgi:hypothetical protein